MQAAAPDLSDAGPRLEAYIRAIADFPRQGQIFRDMSRLFADPAGFQTCVSRLSAPFAPGQIAKVAGLEARGFVLGGAVAHQLQAGFVPVGHAGSLPAATLRQSFSPRPGASAAMLEISEDALEPGEQVLLVHDILAGGERAEAGIRLIERFGAEVRACAFIAELPERGGRQRLERLGVPVFSLTAFQG